jgi:uncharacterized protein (TIGR02001 family)
MLWGDAMLRYSRAMKRFFPVHSKILILPLFMTGAAISSAASAQTEPAGSITVSASVDLVNDYRFRGLSRTGGDLAIQPSVHVSHESGVYVGAWGSNVDDMPSGGDIEVDIYAGYVTEIASGTDLDVGVTYYTFPDGKKANGPSDYFEVSSKLSHTLGPVEATGRIAYSWDQAALSGDNLYLSVDLAAGLPNTPVTIQAGAGYTDGSLAYYAPSGHYWDWNVGASGVFGRVTAGVKYVDTNISRVGIKAVDKFYKPRVVFSLGYFF